MFIVYHSEYAFAYMGLYVLVLIHTSIYMIYFTYLLRESTLPQCHLVYHIHLFLLNVCLLSSYKCCLECDIGECCYLEKQALQSIYFVISAFSQLINIFSETSAFLYLYVHRFIQMLLCSAGQLFPDWDVYITYHQFNI